jgi:hypothetical protein
LWIDDRGRIGQAGERGAPLFVGYHMVRITHDDQSICS